MRLLKDVLTSGEGPSHHTGSTWSNWEHLKQLDVTAFVHDRAGLPTFSQAREGVKNRPLQK